MLCDRRAPRMRALLAITLLAAAILGAAPARAADGAVLLRVRLWTTPNHAARGDVVKYEIMVDNAGDARASRVRVTLPFSKHMQVVRAQFDHQATWVSALGEDELTVMFGRLPGGESRRAQIFFTIGQDAPDGLQVRVRATARHERDAGHGEKSNYTTLTIGGQEADTRPNAVVEPSAAPAGATLAVRVRNYFPGERISTWLNTPDGVRETRLATTAGEQGQADMELHTRELPPGAYTLVVYGSSSKITMVVPFTIH